MKNNGSFVLAFGFLMIGLGLAFCQGMPTKNNTVEEIRSPADFESGPRPIIVAVVDTGFDFNANWTNILKAYPYLKKPRICKYGHKDYTGTGLQDAHGHGTHVAGLIAQYADNANYCMVILKYHDPQQFRADNLEQTRKSFERAIALKVDIINYSGGGQDRSEAECQLIKKALDSGIRVVAAAGNESRNINDTPYYPAMCDDRVEAVANVYETGNYVQSSNFTTKGPGSRFLFEEKGWNVMSLAPGNQLRVMTGTSQAAAIKTGKDIKNWKKP